MPTSAHPLPPAHLTTDPPTNSAAIATALAQATDKHTAYLEGSVLLATHETWYLNANTNGAVDSENTQIHLSVDSSGVSNWIAYDTTNSQPIVTSYPGTTSHIINGKQILYNQNMDYNLDGPRDDQYNAIFQAEISSATIEKWQFKITGDAVNITGVEECDFPTELNLVNGSINNIKGLLRTTNPNRQVFNTEIGLEKDCSDSIENLVEYLLGVAYDDDAYSTQVFKNDTNSEIIFDGLNEAVQTTIYNNMMDEDLPALVNFTRTSRSNERYVGSNDIAQSFTKAKENGNPEGGVGDEGVLSVQKSMIAVGDTFAIPLTVFGLLNPFSPEAGTENKSFKVGDNIPYSFKVMIKYNVTLVM